MTSQATVAVIVPAYGRHDLTRATTRAVLSERDVADVVVVDNQGGYQRIDREIVLRPDRNLGWAGGCNFGLHAARGLNYAAYVLLNNDVELSTGFINGLIEAWQATKAGLVAPSYDHSWTHQWPPTLCKAGEYSPRPIEISIPFADGTCIFIPKQTLDVVGELDSGRWPRYGWGCDKDLALRVRRIGLDVFLTFRSYLHHMGRMTASSVLSYSDRDAQDECDRGMTNKWGPEWKTLLFSGHSGFNTRDLRHDEIMQLRAAAPIK